VIKKWVDVSRNGLMFQEMGWCSKKWVDVPRNRLMFQEMGWCFKKWIDISRNGLMFQGDLSIRNGLMFQGDLSIPQALPSWDHSASSFFLGSTCALRDIVVDLTSVTASWMIWGGHCSGPAPELLPRIGIISTCLCVPILSGIVVCS